MDAEIIERIEGHLRHAKEKHPHFADFLMQPCPIMEGGTLEDQVRRIEQWHLIRDFWARQAKVAKDSIQTEDTAESILKAEVFEIFEAAARGDLKHARDEAFDAIAVLLRMVEEMDRLGEKIPKSKKVEKC